MSSAKMIQRIAEAASVCETVPSPCFARLEAGRFGITIKVVRISRHAEFLCPWSYIEPARVNPLTRNLTRLVKMVAEQ